MKHKSCDIQDHLPQKFICYGGLVEIQQLNIQSLLQLKPINIHPQHKKIISNVSMDKHDWIKNRNTKKGHKG